MAATGDEIKRTPVTETVSPVEDKVQNRPNNIANELSNILKTSQTNDQLQNQHEKTSVVSERAESTESVLTNTTQNNTDRNKCADSRRKDFKDFEHVTVGAAPPIIKSRGTLFHKKRGAFSRWKQHYVVLDDNQLQMNLYHSEGDYEKLASCKISIDLRFVDKIIPTKPGILSSNFPFKFFRRAGTGLSNVKMASNSEEERAEWITTIEDLIAKIRATPDRESPSELQKTASLAKGNVTTSDTQTSEVVTSAPEEDVEIRPRKPSKCGMKVDPTQLTSIKLKRIDSEKEDTVERREARKAESFDPEEKFGVQLKRVSSERRVSSPQPNKEDEAMVEFKIKFNSLKRTKNPKIPMSEKLRSTVGDIVANDKLDPGAPGNSPKVGSESPRKRSPSPNIPISDSVRSVMKKTDGQAAPTSELNEKNDSNICHTPSTEIKSFELNQELGKKNTVLRSESSIKLEIKSKNNRKEQADRLISFCHDGKLDNPISNVSDINTSEDQNHVASVEIKKPVNTHSQVIQEIQRSEKMSNESEKSAEAIPEKGNIQRITIKTSIKKTQEQGKVVQDAAADIQEKNRESLQIERSAEEAQNINTSQKTEDQNCNKYEETYRKKQSDIIVESTCDTVKEDALMAKAELENVVTKIETNLEKDFVVESNATNSVPKELHSHSSIEENSIENQLDHKKQSDVQEHTGEDLMLNSSKVTVAEINFLNPEDELESLDMQDEKDSSTDSMKEFMAQMLDERNTSQEQKNYPKEKMGLDLIDVVVSNDEKIPQPMVSPIAVSTPLEEEKTLIHKSEELIEEKGYNRSNSSFYEMFNILAEDGDAANCNQQGSHTDKGVNDEHAEVTNNNNNNSNNDSNNNSNNNSNVLITINHGSNTSIDNSLDDTAPQPVEGISSPAVPLNFVITRHSKLTAEEFSSKRPSDISIGSSECDEPLPKFCFLGTSDRSSTGSAVLKNIISAAEEELKKLPDAITMNDEKQLTDIDLSTEFQETKIKPEEEKVNREKLQETNNIQDMDFDSLHDGDKLTTKNIELGNLENSKVEEVTQRPQENDHLFSRETISKTEESTRIKTTPKIVNKNSEYQKLETDDYFPSFDTVMYRLKPDDPKPLDSSDELRASGITGLKDYLKEEDKHDPTFDSTKAAINRLGHSVAIEKLRNEVK